MKKKAVVELTRVFLTAGLVAVLQYLGLTPYIAPTPELPSYDESR